VSVLAVSFDERARGMSAWVPLPKVFEAGTFNPSDLDLLQDTEPANLAIASKARPQSVLGWCAGGPRRGSWASRGRNSRWNSQLGV
jgi:hypothetical protein